MSKRFIRTTDPLFRQAGSSSTKGPTRRAQDQPAPAPRLPQAASLAHQRVQLLRAAHRHHRAQLAELCRADACRHGRPQPGLARYGRLQEAGRRHHAVSSAICWS
jgi:hypothetical protein